MNKSRQLALPGIALAIVLSLVLSCGLVACEKVVASTQPAVVRIIDASYSVPAINLNLDGAPFAANIGQGAFTKYGTLAAKSSALITITPAAGGQPLISARSAFLPGHPQSILISDNDLTPAAYTITMLDDQRTPAAAGHSAFRFVNRALKAGAVDIYMLPNGVTIANAVPVVTNLSPGAVTGYISFSSQSVKMVVTAAGVTTAKYTSPAINLTGGEVRTTLLMDSQSTIGTPVRAFIGSDVD